jgi:hypothetical protein
MVLVRALLAVLVSAVLGSAAPAVRADGELPGTPGVRVALLQQLDLNRDGRPDVTVIDGSFASARDRVIVVDGGNNMAASGDWQQATDFADDTWIFDVGSTGRAKLIVRFGQEDGHDVAYLYDDQDKDGFVAYRLEAGRVVVAESAHWSIKLASSARWLNPDGSLNLDLTVYSDGVNVQVSPWLDESRSADGTVDSVVEERTYPDGSPWYELRYILTPSRSDQALSRSAIRVTNLRSRPAEPVGYAFFPLLDGASWYLDRYWFDTPPTVSMDWRTGSIKDVGILGYPVRQGYYVNGPFYFAKGRANLIGFENPQADYRLAGPAGPTTDPDLHVRISYWAPHQPGADNGPTPIEQVSYDWRQRDEPGLGWDYKIDVAGTKALTTVVSFPDFGLIVPPYDDLPYWVTEGEWAYGTFVAVEQGPYLSSEGIYEWYTAEGMTANATVTGDDYRARIAQHDYLLGRSREPPARFYQDIRPGLRAEYADLNGPARLHFSPIDRRLHLLKARTGVWRIRDTGREVRYASLDGEHINRWSSVDVSVAQAGLVDFPEEASSLFFAADQLIYVDWAGVRLRSVEVPAALFTATPPRNHDEWVRLGSLLEQYRAPFAGDDLRAMFEQFTAPVQVLPAGSVEDFRLTEDGFRFAVRLREHPSVAEPWAAGLEAGTYLVRYRLGSGYSAEPLAPPALEVSPVLVAGGALTALTPAELAVSVRNHGHQDVHGAPIIFRAGRAGGPTAPIGRVVADVLGGTTAEIRLAWAPPTDGDWVIQASAGDRAAGPPGEVTVAAAPTDDLGGLLHAQGLGDLGQAIVGMLALLATVVAGGLGLLAWRDPVGPRAGARGVEETVK